MKTIKKRKIMFKKRSKKTHFYQGFSHDEIKSLFPEFPEQKKEPGTGPGKPAEMKKGVDAGAESNQEGDDSGQPMLS